MQNISEVILLAGMGVAALEDYRTKEVSVILMSALYSLGLIVGVLGGKLTWFTLLSSIATGIVFLVIACLTGEAIGYGDGLLFAVTGLHLGLWENLLLIMGLFLASGMLALFLFVIKRKKGKETLPLIPILLVIHVLGIWQRMGGVS